jgi:hypothetical protein
MSISSGQLCIEVNDHTVQDSNRLPLMFADHNSHGIHLTGVSNMEDKILSSIALDDIDSMVAAMRWTRWTEIREPGTVLLGSLSWPMAEEDKNTLNPFSAFPLMQSLGPHGVFESEWEDGSSTREVSVLPNGWTK